MVAPEVKVRMIMLRLLVGVEQWNGGHSGLV